MAQQDDFEVVRLVLDYGKDDAGYGEIFRRLADDGEYKAHRSTDATPEHFPSQDRHGPQVLDVIMFQPQMPPEGQNQWLSTEQVRAQMDAAELEPEDALVTLRVAKDKRGDFALGALASVWSHGDCRFVLSASSDGGKRKLHVSWCGNDVWRGHWRFPARRKGSPKP